MSLLADTARFRTDDPDELVIASLACPLCLHSDEVELGSRKSPMATIPQRDAVCRRCEEPWRVYIDPRSGVATGADGRPRTVSQGWRR